MTEAAIVQLIEAAVRQMRAERDAAVEALTVMLTDVIADTASNTARLDRIDPQAPIPGFVTAKEAAFACDFSAESVRQWAKAGQVTAQKEGGVWKVELQSVMERARRHR